MTFSRTNGLSLRGIGVNRPVLMLVWPEQPQTEMAGESKRQRSTDRNSKGNFPETPLAIRLALVALRRSESTKVGRSEIPAIHRDGLHRLQVGDFRKTTFLALAPDLIGNVEIPFGVPRV